MLTLNRAPPIGYYLEFTNTRALKTEHLGFSTAHIHCLHIIQQI
jgi:hypothetical protein